MSNANFCVVINTIFENIEDVLLILIVYKGLSIITLNKIFRKKYGLGGLSRYFWQNFHPKVFVPQER